MIRSPIRQLLLASASRHVRHTLNAPEIIIRTEFFLVETHQTPGATQLRGRRWIALRPSIHPSPPFRKIFRSLTTFTLSCVSHLFLSRFGGRRGCIFLLSFNNRSRDTLDLRCDCVGANTIDTGTCPPCDFSAPSERLLCHRTHCVNWASSAHTVGRQSRRNPRIYRHRSIAFAPVCRGFKAIYDMETLS
jgi:hypothetical protein